MKPHDQGERLKREGIDKAAKGNQGRILAGMARLLRAAVHAPGRVVTIDDGTDLDELRRPYAGGGKWRGAVTATLRDRGFFATIPAPDGNGLVTRRSQRPSRHGCPVTAWLLTASDAEALALAEHADALAAQFGDEGQQPLLPFPE